jgi:molybdopterin synthase catalytic subunit
MEGTFFCARLGDATVSAEASADSFAACQAGLEALKTMKSIDKREVFV